MSSVSGGVGGSVPSELFDDDYLYFYADTVGSERSDADAAAIARLLSLEPGMRVLDVPCGEGRIAGRLARLGCNVVGVDSQRNWLELARARYPAVAFEHGDMRSLPFDAEFDAVVNWYTSFGYFDPETNDRVLAGLARALRPGGRLLVEMHNPWRLARLLDTAGGSSSVLMERDGNLMVDRISLGDGGRRSRTERVIVRDGRVRRLEFWLEQVPAPELIGRLRRAGFPAVELFGAGGEEFKPSGRRLIAVAVRGGPATAPSPPQVSLRPVDREIVRAVCELELAPGQERYVAPSSYSLAEAQFHPGAWVRAIYAGETLVGMLVLIADEATPRYFLVRLLIGGQYQGQGYGRAAIALLAEHVRGLPGSTELETSCIPGPDSPIGFYLALGFEDTGRIWHGENVLRLGL